MTTTILDKKDVDGFGETEYMYFVILKFKAFALQTKIDSRPTYIDYQYYLLCISYRCAVV